MTARPSGDDESAPPAMLSLDAVHETYYAATGKASDIARQLSFAGIGMVWILSGSSLTPTRRLDIENDLLWAGLVLVVALALDLLQYAYRSAAWGFYGLYMENRGIVEDRPLRWINWPSNSFFVMKLGAVGTAYVSVAMKRSPLVAKSESPVLAR